MPKFLDYFMLPIASGLDVAAYNAKVTGEYAADRVRDFAQDPLRFPFKTPFSAIIGGLGAYGGSMFAMGVSKMILGSSAIFAAPIAIPVGITLGVGLAAIKVMAFTGILYGGLSTVKTAWEMTKDAFQKTSGQKRTPSQGIKGIINRVTPKWFKRKAGPSFDAAAQRTDITTQQKPAPKPAPGSKQKFTF